MQSATQEYMNCLLLFYNIAKIAGGPYVRLLYITDKNAS